MEDRRANGRKALLDEGTALADLAVGEPVWVVPDGEREHPFVQAHATDADRVLDALRWPGDEAVE